MAAQQGRRRGAAGGAVRACAVRSVAVHPRAQRRSGPFSHPPRRLYRSIWCLQSPPFPLTSIAPAPPCGQQGGPGAAARRAPHRGRRRTRSPAQHTGPPLCPPRRPCVYSLHGPARARSAEASQRRHEAEASQRRHEAARGRAIEASGMEGIEAKPSDSSQTDWTLGPARPRGLLHAHEAPFHGPRSVPWAGQAAGGPAGQACRTGL